MVKPLALATCSAPARVARAIGLPALLVNTASVSAVAEIMPNGSKIVTAAAMQKGLCFIAFLPIMSLVRLYPMLAAPSPPSPRKIAAWPPFHRCPTALRAASTTSRGELKHAFHHGLQRVAGDEVDF